MCGVQALISSPILLPNPDLFQNVNGEEIKLDGGTSLDTSVPNPVCDSPGSCKFVKGGGKDQ